MAGTAPPRYDVERIEPPPGLATYPPVADPDATYAWELRPAAGDRRSPEAWARAVFEGAPAALRAGIVTGWRVALLLRLGPGRAPDHVLGWRIRSSTERRITLSVGSPLLAAGLVVEVEGGAIRHMTFVRYRNALGRVAWGAAAPIHRMTVPYLLRHAARGGPAGPGTAAAGR